MVSVRKQGNTGARTASLFRIRAFLLVTVARGIFFLALLVHFLLNYSIRTENVKYRMPGKQDAL